MVDLGISFYTNILSVIATTYILTWYFLTPSPNQCQMTFMMEPPKFLPVGVEDSDPEERLTYPKIDSRKSGVNYKTESRYKLYMYSEFGFPMAADVRRDLKDSMPVLFVPGNAGSYQQVRSLASTCIRKQLQSLDAFKFIFYTIDFDGQFSGISGDLIDKQTEFVQRSLRQIERMHPSDTEGVIVIGHSVGGFIAKFLFTKPNFRPNSVPLMISLASPLTRPYLFLDDKMGEIYRKTEKYWNKFKIEDRETIAISISGGGSDRLVPMHTSLDPTFDLSLTAESMKDVYLSTDHVCVTWCRELMHKLANLLSSLMDKKRTRLISDKSLKLSIIESELLLKRRSNSSIISTKGDWSTKRPSEILDSSVVHHVHRNQLKDNIYLLDMHSNQDLLIIIDHIETLKPSTVFGCNDLSQDEKKITCHGRSNLIPLASSVPTSRYEPRKTVLRISFDSLSDSISHVGFDFTSHTLRAAPPEMISIQRKTVQKVSSLHIPSLLELLIRRILFLPKRLQISSNLNSTTELLEIELNSLESKSPATSIELVSGNCISKGKPSSATILYFKKGHLSASSYLPVETKDLQETTVKLSLRDSILSWTTENGDEKSHLDIYFDGTCENRLEVKLDILNLAAQMLQKDLGSILSCVVFLVAGAIVSSAIQLSDMSRCAEYRKAMKIILLAGSTLIVVTSRLTGRDKRIPMASTSSVDESTSIILTLMFSYGLLSFSTYFTRRLIDIATIINNTHMILKRRVTNFKEERTKLDRVEETENSHNSGPNKKTLKTEASTKTDIDWPLIGLAIASGAFLSSAPMTVLIIAISIRTSLSINLVTISSEETKNKHCCGQRHVEENSSVRNMKDELVVNLILMSLLVLIVNIPDALLKSKSGFATLSSASLLDQKFVGVDYVAISLVLIMKKLICNKLEIGSWQDKSSWTKNGLPLEVLVRLTTSIFTSALTIVPILLIESNIRLITTVELLLSMWLLNYLNFKLVNTSKRSS